MFVSQVITGTKYSTRLTVVGFGYAYQFDSVI